MKKISTLALCASAILTAQTDEVQKYEIESGKIQYSSEGEGLMMGLVKVEVKGTQNVVFTHYGMKNLVTETIINKETANGSTSTREQKTMIYQNADLTYSVNFRKKEIMREKGPAAVRIGLLKHGEHAGNSTEETMQSYGAKKIGKDKVMGYDCILWQLKGSQECLYKGIPLRIDTDINGMKHRKIATKIQFDINIDKSEFLLPNYPFYDRKGNKLALNRTKLDEASTPTIEEKKEDSTVLLPIGYVDKLAIKLKAEAKKKEESMRFAQGCFMFAETLENANKCNKKVSEIDSKEQDDFTSWSKEDKANVLSYIDKYLSKISPCIKKAKDAKAIGKCNNY